MPLRTQGAEVDGASAIRFILSHEKPNGAFGSLGHGHADLEKNMERLHRQRLLYIAKDHGLAGFLDACQAKRTVCVIRRGSDRSELVLYGSPAAVAYARKHVDQWKWWK